MEGEEGEMVRSGLRDPSRPFLSSSVVGVHARRTFARAAFTSAPASSTLFLATCSGTVEGFRMFCECSIVIWDVLGSKNK